MYVPTYYYDRDMGRTGRAIKNSVDMNLCIDAMKTLYTNPNIGKFVLCTGDRDFIPLVNSIRQQGKEVIIIGIGGAASSHLAQSADEFIFYETLIGKRPSTLTQDQPKARMPEKGREYDYDQPDQPTPPSRDRDRDRDRESIPAPLPLPIAPRENTPIAASLPAPVAQPDIFDVLVQAVQVARERDFVCSFGSLKLLMKELTSGEFREDKYRDAAGRPFAKFKDFVMEAERRGKIQVFTNGAVNEVFLPGEDPYALSRFAMDLKEEAPAPTRPTPVVEEPRNNDRQANNRRRRRRSRGGRGQTNGTNQVAANGDLPEELEDLDLAFVEAIEDALDAPSASDEMFDALLGRLDEEEVRREALESFDALELIDAPLEAIPNTPAVLDEPIMPDLPILDDEFTAPILDEPTTIESDDEFTAPILDEPVAVAEPVVAEVVAAPSEAAARTTEEEDDAASSTTPLEFSNEEWETLFDLVGNADRPLSFVQIHDLLREARNLAGLTRTNEELRSMIKQAINLGKLARSGKGTRVVYRLAPKAPASEPPSEPVAETMPAAEPTLVVEAPAAPAEEPATVVEAVVETAKPKRSRRKKSEAVAENASEPVAAAPEAPVVPVVEEVAAPVVEAPAEEAKPKRSRRKKAQE
jgi:hypothetical protein